MKALRRALADTWRLAAPYFWVKDKGEFSLGRFGAYRMQERWFALLALAAIIVSNLGEVYVTVRLNYCSTASTQRCRSATSRPSTPSCCSSS